MVREYDDEITDASRALVEEYERSVQEYRKTEDPEVFDGLLAYAEIFESNPSRYKRTRIDSDGVIHYRVNRYYDDALVDKGVVRR